MHSSTLPTREHTTESNVLVCHHFEPSCTDSINNLGVFFEGGDFELLLEENACLLVGGLDDVLHEDVVWQRGGRV